MSGKPARTLDESNIDWVPPLHLGHTKRQQRSQGDQLRRFERARRRTEIQQQHDEQKAMFLSIVQVFGRETIAEIVS